MAQHFPILESDKLPKRLQTVRTGILKDFERNKLHWEYIKGSLKYNYDEDRFYSEHENDEVFHAIRYVGNGVVWGDTHASFEVHFNKLLKKVTEIYLVA